MQLNYSPKNNTEMSENKTEITAKQVIESKAFADEVNRRMNVITTKIKNAKDGCKTGERLRRTPAIRLYEMGLLEPEAFTDAYICIMAKTPVDLPSSLRSAIKDEGDNIFAKAYLELYEAENGKEEKQ